MGYKTQGTRIKFRRRSSGKIQISVKFILRYSTYTLEGSQYFGNKNGFSIQKYKEAAHLLSFDQQRTV
jgi:hypothetical protein